MGELNPGQQSLSALADAAAFKHSDAQLAATGTKIQLQKEGMGYPVAVCRIRRDNAVMSKDSAPSILH